ncbi:hypothetical protein TNCV_21801 [Trichonephila clavipes]|nr:hypothetical protein TNCV_21801 [Trichonephila clavipes]
MNDNLHTFRENFHQFLISDHRNCLPGNHHSSEVSACSEDGRFGLLLNLRSNSSQRCSMGFRSGSEKGSPVFEHPFRQTTSVQASMCEWSSYPAGREMSLPRNIAIYLGVQHRPECPQRSQSFMFPMAGSN